MQRRLLIITKEPEFDARDEVVLGQCEPFTSGWSLKMVDPIDKNKVDTLIVGTYTDLRRIQESCALIDEPASIRRRVDELRKLLTAGVTETVAVQFANRSPVLNESATVEMKAVPSGPMIPTHTPGGLMNLEPNGSVLVATVVQPERADDAPYLKTELQTLLNCKPKAVVMDLGRVPTLSQNAFRELAAVRDTLRANGSTFALCNVANALQQTLKKISDPLDVFPTQASAMAKMATMR